MGIPGAGIPGPATAGVVEDGGGLRLSDAHVQRTGRVKPGGVVPFLFAIAAAAARCVVNATKPKFFPGTRILSISPYSLNALRMFSSVSVPSRLPTCTVILVSGVCRATVTTSVDAGGSGGRAPPPPLDPVSEWRAVRARLTRSGRPITRDPSIAVTAAVASSCVRIVTNP